MTPAGIEPATFQFVAQHLNHYATAVPTIGRSCVEIADTARQMKRQLHDALTASTIAACVVTLNHPTS